MIRKVVVILFLLGLAGLLSARPLSIIIVTSDAGSESGYSEFLRNIYLDNADVEIDARRYDESLSDTKKQQLAAADLIIVSSDNPGSDYNGDSAFWSTLSVPILNHNTTLARSNSGENWDWFGSDQVAVPLSELYIVDANDPLFDGIDTAAGMLTLFETPENYELPDAPYAGYGTVLAADASGLPMIVYFDGTEPNYYSGSLYDPNGGARMFFAMPAKPSTFFGQAAPPARQLLRNAVMTLLAECYQPGDHDCDRDVDLEDLAVIAQQWLLQTTPDDVALLAEYWLAGVDLTAPTPNPFDWTDKPVIGDGGTLTMKAKNADDDLHGVQYAFECLEDPALSTGWQYDRDYSPANLPIGVDLSFRTQARDTSGRFNETLFSSTETVRTNGLFYYSADASAAVALDANRFIMADDEFNVLQVYDGNAPASDPVMQTDISTEIKVDPAHPEADIEGATWFGSRVFWITSHGRSAGGDYWPSRYQFFATTVAGDESVTVKGVYANLIDHLIQYDRTWQANGIDLGLEAAIGTLGDHIDLATLPGLAPKVDGLNIEGLCASADGSKMFLAFRNPRPRIDGKNMALVIPLANPEAVVLAGADPNLEAPILIDLDGLGIRSIEYSPTVGEYLIVAGSHRGGEHEPVQYLYNYSIEKQDRDKLATFSDLTPEALFQFPGQSAIQLLSDDGTRMINIGTETEPVWRMNKLLPKHLRTYRTQTVQP